MTEEEMLNTIWFNYPSDLCKNKRGGKPPALQAIKKRKFTEQTFNKFILDLKAHIRNDRKDPEAYRWPFVSTYINQHREQDVIETVDKPVQVLSQCSQPGCKNEVHGPRFKHCVYHLPQDQNDPVLIKLRQKYIDMGLKQRPDESNIDHVHRMRAVYGKLIGTIL